MISSLKSRFDFFNSRAIYISDAKISVYHWYRGQFGSSYLFNKDDAGTENFRRYLKESDNSPAYILVDVREEEFRHETIPHVFGADRKALIERKQSRLFRDTSYFYTQDQGREVEGRRDDRILVSAITNEELIKPWLEMFDEFKIPVKSVLSIPLLLQSYIKTLPDISDHALFVTMESISGIRQTFFQNKALKISRLSKLPRYGTESYAPIVNTEVEKIKRYINSLRLIPVDSPLDVYVLADKATLDEIESNKINVPMVQQHLLDINELAKSTMDEVKQGAPFCDQLLIRYLFESRPANCYASSHEMRYAKMRNMKYAMNISSILLLLFSFGYSGLNLVNGMTYKQESESSKNKSAFYQTRYDLAKERLPKTPVDAAQLKVAVEAAERLMQFKSTPFEMLSIISQGMDQFPTIRLDDLDWSFSMDPNKGIAATSLEGNNISIINNTADTKQVRYYQISNMKAHIEPFDGNYREAIATVNKFAETLREKENVHDVSIESFPLDISSTASLQGDVEAVGQEALFSLRAVVGVYE